MSRGRSPVLQKNRPDRPRSVSLHCAPALEARYLQLHAQLIAENRPLSGRRDSYVYYWAYGRLCWRRDVVPRDPRTPAQQRSRAAFASASKAWSGSHSVTEEQRDAWRADAAKIKSTPRLGQSGPLTAQNDFVGRNSVKERWGLALLWDPPVGERKKVECGRQNPESATQVQQAQSLAQSSSGTRRACAAPAPSLPRPARAAAKKAIGTFCPAQVPFRQRLTQPSSDRPHIASQPLPVQYRWGARSPCHVGSIDLPLWSSTLAHIRRNARIRALWRGG